MPAIQKYMDAEAKTGSQMLVQKSVQNIQRLKPPPVGDDRLGPQRRNTPNSVTLLQCKIP
jgi:hypothetical protein